MHAAASASGNGLTASAEVERRGGRAGWVIAGASGSEATSGGALIGGEGDVVTMTDTLPDGRRRSITVVIGLDPEVRRDEPVTTIGRAGLRRNRG